MFLDNRDNEILSPPQVRRQDVKWQLLKMNFSNQPPPLGSLNPALVKGSAGEFSQQLMLNCFKDLSQSICIPAHLQSLPSSYSSAVSSLSGV